MWKHSLLFFSGIATTLVCFIPSHAQAKPPAVQIVLFSPADLEPPQDAEVKLQQFGRYTENFFKHWMTEAGYPPANSKIFHRDQTGKIIVAKIKGEKNVDSGAYDRWGYGRDVKQQTISQYKLPTEVNMCWIFVWLGKDRDFKDWRGLGDPRSGGICMVQYPREGEGHITKTLIHELGHVFSLPHFGPVKGFNEDVSLMGPNLFNYRRVMKKPFKTFYLLPASAAMIWKHPLFNNQDNSTARLPSRVELTQYKPIFNYPNKSITIQGKIQSHLKPHSLVIVDESQADPGPYWKKSYAARLKSDGSFEIKLQDTSPANGTLLLLPCFENGINSGDAASHGLGSAIKKQYQFDGRKFLFSP